MKNALKKIFRPNNENRHLPCNPMVGDIYLASFPKSGNTWLRFLVANAIKCHFEIEREVNFFTIQDIIPSVKGCGMLSQSGPFGRHDLPRVIKTHQSYNSYCHRVIYLLRNPTDVMLSYFNYLKTYESISHKLTLAEFIRLPKYGVTAWIDHVQSWTLVKNKPGQIIRLLSYEELLEDTSRHLSGLMGLIGLTPSEEAINTAIKLSSRENMRYSELKHSSSSIISRGKARFVGTEKDKFTKELRNEDKSYISEKTTTLLSTLGYGHYIS